MTEVWPVLHYPLVPQDQSPSCEWPHCGCGDGRTWTCLGDRGPVERGVEAGKSGEPGAKTQVPEGRKKAELLRGSNRGGKKHPDHAQGLCKHR